MYLTTAKKSQLYDYCYKISNQNPGTVVRYIRGQKCRTKNELFNEFSSALQFPYYFGENWDAFDECINDLDWIDGKSYIIVILDADAVFHNDDAQFKTLIQVIQRASTEWGKGTNTAIPVPFHVIFHSEEVFNEIKQRISSIQETNIDILRLD